MRVSAVAIVFAARVAHADCVAPADADKAVAAADKVNEERFDKELAKAKAKKVSLPELTWDEPGTRAGPMGKDGSIVAYGRKHVLLMGTGARACGEPEPADPFRDPTAKPYRELVQRGDTIFQVSRRRTFGKTTTIKVCGCAAPNSSPAGPGCGAAPRPFGIGYEVPDGTKYGGELAVTYVEDVVQLEYGYTKKGACPPPPAPKAPQSMPP